MMMMMTDLQVDRYCRPLTTLSKSKSDYNESNDTVVIVDVAVCDQRQSMNWHFCHIVSIAASEVFEVELLQLTFSQCSSYSIPLFHRCFLR